MLCTKIASALEGLTAIYLLPFMTCCFLTRPESPPLAVTKVFAAIACSCMHTVSTANYRCSRWRGSCQNGSLSTRIFFAVSAMIFSQAQWGIHKNISLFKYSGVHSAVKKKGVEFERFAVPLHVRLNSTR